MNKTGILKNIGLAGFAATMLTGGDRPVQPEQLVVPTDHITTSADASNENVTPFQTGVEKLLTRSGKDVVEGYSAFLKNAKGGSSFTLAEYRDFDAKTQEVINTLAEMGIWGNIRGADGDDLNIKEISQLGELFGVDVEQVHVEPEKALYLNTGAAMELTGIDVLTLSGGGQTNAIKLRKGNASISIAVRGYRGSFFYPNEPFDVNKRIIIKDEVNRAGTSKILVILNQHDDPIEAELMDPSWIRPDLARTERGNAYQFAIKELIPVTPKLDEAVSVGTFLDAAFMHPDGSRLYFPNTDYDFSLIQLAYSPLVVITDKTGQRWTVKTTYYEENHSLADTIKHAGLVTGMSVAINPKDPYTMAWTLHRGGATGSAYESAVWNSDVTFQGSLDWPAQSGLVEQYEAAIEQHPGIRLLTLLGYPLKADVVTDVEMQQMFIRAFDKAYFDPHTLQGILILPADSFEWDITAAAIVVKSTDPQTNKPVVLTLLPEYFDFSYETRGITGDLCISEDGVFLKPHNNYGSRVSSGIVGSFVGDGDSLKDFRLSSQPNFH